jgi:uncharacterized protein YjbI with pentapeptide repeats
MPSSRPGAQKGPRVPAVPDVRGDLAASSTIPEQTRGLELQEEAFVGVDLSGRDVTALTMIEGRLEGVVLSEAIARRMRLRDVVVDRGDWANVDASEATWTRVELREVRLTGAVFAGARLDDVRFVACRLDLSSFRFAQMDGVRFEGCRLEDADLYHAAVVSSAFLSCDLTRVNLAEATFQACEMRDCELQGAGNPERLRGVAMPWQDLVRSTAVLAAGVGVGILDED